jgi:hypothetical protein
MVVRNGFEVHLVYADSKVPLKEFEKDGKIYVEAEPDAEYFVAICRVALIGPPVIVSRVRIDGRSLKYLTYFPSVNRAPAIHGIPSRISGQSIQTALAFSKPRATTGGDGYRGGMGNVVIKLYEGTDPKMELQNDFVTNFATLSRAADVNADMCKKKFLLSTQGNTTISRRSSDVRQVMYKSGALVQTIELNYCSALGLMEAGVLPKPDAWAHQRMKRPAPPGQLTAPAKKMKDPVDPAKDIELIDVTED